ncbi:hypothetical protein [Streptomyces sp. NBC_01615]|uniref:hypothetical protein n=1 Tax=Streptomyces sp. NBC_01615 TaxID=2975898 RepID=UPI003866BD26
MLDVGFRQAAVAGAAQAVGADVLREGGLDAGSDRVAAPSPVPLDSVLAYTAARHSLQDAEKGPFTSVRRIVALRPPAAGFRDVSAALDGLRAGERRQLAALRALYRRGLLDLSTHRQPAELYRRLARVPSTGWESVDGAGGDPFAPQGVSPLVPSLVLRAEHAFAAYVNNDPEPMKQFLHDVLRVRPVRDDHCQAMAEAMLTRTWEEEADLGDDESVRIVLSRCARKGSDLVYDHMVRGHRIVTLDEGGERIAERPPTPEEIVLEQLVPWAQLFDIASVRFAAGRLNPQDQAVARAWSAQHGMTWTQAPLAVGQDPSRGEHTRRLLKAHGREWIRRHSARREAP